MRTPEGIVSYANVETPKRNEMKSQTAGREVLEYSFDLLFNKATSNMTELNNAVQAALEAKFPNLKGKKAPSSYKLPIKDGDLAYEEASAKGKEAGEKKEKYKGHWFITLRSETKPLLLDKETRKVCERGAFHSGCIATASVNASAYSKGGGNGVNFYWGSLNERPMAVKIADGEHWGSQGDSAVSDFADFGFDFNAVEASSEADDVASLLGE